MPKLQVPNLNSHLASILHSPHRMGLQYFEALSPGTIASIIAVLANRLVTGNDVTGYFHYPFLKETLPSSIFVDAIVYGFFGCFVGTIYVLGVKRVKEWVHHWFHSPHLDVNNSVVSQPHTNQHEAEGEGKPLLPIGPVLHNNLDGAATHDNSTTSKTFSFAIRSDSTRAAVSGAIVGLIIGVVGIFVPHTMFWGESQLQNLIDKGRTPLPVFDFNEEGPTSAFTTFAYCMIDPNDTEAITLGFGVGCASLIIITKTIVIGLSLGTGIIGGQFWGPLYVGCAAAHLLTDVCARFGNYFSFARSLSRHPCVVILCTMGSAHVGKFLCYCSFCILVYPDLQISLCVNSLLNTLPVVPFRSHMGIMLILTLTISAFAPEDDPSSSTLLAGDYSAVFPLLVISVFISLMVSRDTIFYSTQTSRGDITAVPEVLCQPGMAGAPAVMQYGGSEASSDDVSTYSASTSASYLENAKVSKLIPPNGQRIQEGISTEEIEVFISDGPFLANTMSAGRPNETNAALIFESHDEDEPKLSSIRLDELLNNPDEISREVSDVVNHNFHRRCHSLPVTQESRGKINQGSVAGKEVGGSIRIHIPSAVKHERSNSRGSSTLVRVPSFGNLEEHQPSLLDQARLRSASSAGDSRHRRVPSMLTPPGPSRSHRHAYSFGTDGGGDSPRNNRFFFGSNINSNPIVHPSIDAGVLSLDDIEKSFNEVLSNKIGTSTGSFFRGK
jgi:Voltage gated chloride channel